MIDNLLYSETQYFRKSQRIFFVLIVFVFGVLLAISLSTKTESLNAWQTLVPCIITLVALLLLYWLRLETTINTKAINYRFIPFHLKPKTIAWADVSTVEIIRYNPIQMYGGWGLRYSFKHGWAYNVSGNYGLKIYFENNKSILIGTSNPEMLGQAIAQLQKKSILKIKSSYK
jgi:hypothetical protein